MEGYLWINLKLIDKLKNKTNISYEEAKIVLEKSNWDILDAILYLEKKGKLKSLLLVSFILMNIRKII